MKAAHVVRVQEPGSVLIERREVPVGVTVRSLLVEVPGVLTVCRLNGGPRYLRRVDWDITLVAPGDLVEFIEYPRGNQENGGLIQFLIGIVVMYFTGNPAFLIASFATLAAGVLTTEPTQPEREDISPTYATGLQGNKARLYMPVPKVCGRHKLYPPLAAQAYQEYNDEDGQQYLFVLLAVGIGNHEIERIMIEDTDIQHFRDVLVARYLPPGVAPTSVLPDVITSTEVSNIDLFTGDVNGGFSASPPMTEPKRVGIDIVMPYGGGVQENNGAVSPLTVQWRVEIAELNQFGSRIGPWTLLAMEAREVATRDPQRWTYTYEIETPMRFEIRVIRLDVKSSNSRHLNDLVWASMRAYLDTEVELHPEVAHLEIVMRSSRQLSGVSQNQIAVIATGMVPELLPDLTFGPEIASRNPAHWLADLWLSPVWGEGLALNQVDLQTLYDLSQVWAERQDRFDHVFDSATDADSAAQLIAGVGRARCFRRGSVRTLARDEWVTATRTAFTTRNTAPNSMVIAEKMPRADTPDGVIMEYWDHRAWNYGLPLICPAPGVTTPQRPIRMRKPGITGRTHAFREGLYEAAKLALRRQTVECVTEMQGSLPTFGSAVRWQTALLEWQSGDVVEWTDETLTARLTEPPRWGADPLHIIFIEDNGYTSDPIEVSPGTMTTEVILASDPGFNLSTEDGTRDRTQYLLGTLGQDEMIVKVTALQDGGTEGAVQMHKVAGFVDDEIIHLVDVPYLPSPGEIQDPVDLTPGEAGGGTVPVVNITNKDLTSLGQTTVDASIYRMQADGRLFTQYGGDYSGAQSGFIANEWLANTPVETPIAAQFEVRAVLMDGVAPETGPALDTWHLMGVDLEWRRDTPGVGGTILIEVRDVATQTIQDAALVTIAVAYISV